MNSSEKSHSALTELLDANRSFALGARGTTNHCPMALIALQRMGAGPDRLLDFFSMWAREFAFPVNDIGASTPREEWRNQLGVVSAFEGLQLCFHEWMKELGIDPVLETVLKQIPFAPATGAFHALIRLAYGLEANHLGEISAGLSFLVTRHLDTGLSVNGRLLSANAEQALAHLSSAMQGSTFPGTSIVAQLVAVANDHQFVAAVTMVPFKLSTLDEMAALALAAYWQTKNFIALHMVTGLHAARLLFARLPEELILRLMPSLWTAFCAAYVSIGAPALNNMAVLENEVAQSPLLYEDWPALFNLAMTSKNDHVIKMTYSCSQENKQHSSPLYIACVRRLLAS